MKKAIGQTVRDLKREVNKKVLKVPGIEQKVLDATSNEAWGPHGSLLADIAQASRNYYEYQMIMAVIWKRISDTRKNWRHVYKALTVLEYMVAHGSERVIDEIKERAHQISTLSDFYYIDSSGRDQGSNVRKKSQSLIVLVNDKERIAEVRQKAAANRNKFHSNSGGGMYRPGSYSGSGTYGDKYDDDRYRSREEDRSGYGSGRERDWGYRDDDRYGRDGDRYGRDYEESYSGDGYRDDEYRGRSQSVGDYRYGSRNRSSDRDPDHSYDDDGHRSSRGSSTKAEDLSLEGRLERKLSEQNTSAPPSYEEIVSQSPLHNERGGEISAASAPKGSSPVSDNPHQTYAPTGSSLFSDNPTETTAADKTAASGSHVAEASEFDPRGPVSDSFPPNVLALAPSASEKTASQGNANPDSTVSFTSPQSASNDFNPLFEDPFGDSPFKAIPSTETAPSQPQTHQSLEPSQSSGPYEETVSNFGFGDSFSFVPYSTSGAGYTQPLSSNSAFVPQELSTPSQETDILADILPPAPLPGITSQQNFTAPPDAQSSSEQTASQSLFVQTGQLAQPPFSVPASQHAQQSFPAHADQHAHSGGHMYGGFHSQSMLPQFQGGHMAPTGQLSQSANYFTQHGGSQSPTDQAQASHFNNSGNFIAQPPAAKQNEPSKDKFETKSTVWADTLSRGLVNLNISGSKINPLADIGIDFDAINRKEKRMEKPSMTPVTSTITMGKAMGSGSGMGRAGASALRPPSNPMMGVGMGMGGYGGMNVPMGMGMGMGQGVQMQPPTGLPPIRGNYNTMMGPGGYPQHPYGGAGYQ